MSELTSFWVKTFQCSFFYPVSLHKFNMSKSNLRWDTPPTDCTNLQNCWVKKVKSQLRTFHSSLEEQTARQIKARDTRLKKRRGGLKKEWERMMGIWKGRMLGERWLSVVLAKDKLISPIIIRGEMARPMPPWLELPLLGYIATLLLKTTERERDDNNGYGWKGLDKKTKLGIMGVERGCFEMLPYCTTGEKQACSLSFPTECVHAHTRFHIHWAFKWGMEGVKIQTHKNTLMSPVICKHLFGHLLNYERMNVLVYVCTFNLVVVNFPNSTSTSVPSW